MEARPGQGGVGCGEGAEGFVDGRGGAVELTRHELERHGEDEGRVGLDGRDVGGGGHGVVAQVVVGS